MSSLAKVFIFLKQNDFKEINASVTENASFLTIR
jgi:hypothetical protein